jgi:hypothetical protein
MLAPGGWLLCLFHARGRARAELEREVEDAAAVPLEVSWRGGSGLDFAARAPRDTVRVTAFTRRG